MAEHTTPSPQAPLPPAQEAPEQSIEHQETMLAKGAAATRAEIKRQQRPTAPLRVPPSPLMARLLGLGAIILVLGAWWAATVGPPELRRISPTILPSPADVLAAFPVLWNERGLMAGIAATMDRVLKGFVLAILIGVPSGILAGSFPAFRAFLAPLEVFGRNIPVAALIPLTLVFFGIDELQKVMFIFIATIPFIFYDSATAIAAVPQRYVETAETLGAHRGQIIWKVLVPLAMPDIFTSLRLLFGLAFGYIMLAELINAEQGLGSLLNISQRRGLKEDIFAILLIITTLAYVIDQALTWFQHGLFPYIQKEG